MPRAAKIDEAATKARHFEHPDSFVGMDGHLYLAGGDRTLQRARLWKREKHCAFCGKYVSWQEMEMDHVTGGLVGRCDCLDCGRNAPGAGNLQPACHECHTGGPRSKHP
jgi:hypothetical protein